MNNMTRKMKDSGIEWIGEIPEEWKTIKSNALYDLRNQKVSDRDFPPLSVTKNGIVPQLSSAAKTNDGDNRKLVKVGDFAINSRSDRRGSCGISKYEGSVSLINTVLRPINNEMNPDYYNLLFHTFEFADEFYKWGHGIVDDLWTTNWQDMKNITLVYPSKKEQDRIASVLNKKVKQINQTFQAIQQEIDALEEYRKSLITETVTKGLDKTVPMKDSGIEWIGEIPENWKIEKAKYSIEINNGSDPIDDDGAVPVYGSGKKSFRTTSDFKVGPAVLLGRKGSISNPLWVENKYWNVDTAFDVKSNGKINLKYYYYCAMCFDYGFYTTQTALPSMTQTEYNNMHIPFPSLQEQSKIVEFLDKKSDRIDKILNQKHQQLTYLDKYKQSIVYEYVTGKKQVPEKEGVKNAQ